MRCLRWLPLLALLAAPGQAADPKDIQSLLHREIIGPRQARLDVIEYVRPRVPVLKPPASAEEWKKEADRLRNAVLDQVVFRGEAQKWRQHKVQIQWQDAIPGGPGYRIRKLRYEALPGLWIPALLYEPEKLAGKVPVMLAVNGHDSAGKAAPYKQARCINLAKRGMLALNVEWLGMGQLRGPGHRHGCMNQLDLCGTPGVAVFYLAMSRGIDVLLSLEHTDPTRVGVSGLSGGGWQTIFLSSLDTRVTLCNPVAGYSSFLTRLEHFKDLGDSEQTPCDLATVADYTHLTALMAPRPTLLTFCAKDNCCFEAGYALPPLEKAARPIYRLLNQETALRTHVNVDPGTHNYEKDNREALYRLIGAHWFAGSKDYDAREIDVRKEIRKGEELAVELPTPSNADFNSLARALMKDLPRAKPSPGGRPERMQQWRQEQSEKLAGLLRVSTVNKQARLTRVAEESKGDVRATYYKMSLAPVKSPFGPAATWSWNIPVVELQGKEVKAVTLLLADGGRRTLHEQAAKLLAEKHRVVLVDPLMLGESKFDTHGWLFGLMLGTVGERPLGVQVEQLGRVAEQFGDGRQQGKEVPFHIHTVGPRSGLIALATAACFPRPEGTLTLQDPPASLKEAIEKNLTYDQAPELFCFGLLEHFDIKHIAALAAPTRVQFVQPSERAQKEFADLSKIYRDWGKDHDPLKGEK